MLLIKMKTSDGFEALVNDSGHAFVQNSCNRLNETHFAGTLPPIRCFLATDMHNPGEHFTTSEQNIVMAIAMQTKDFVDPIGITESWIIFIHERYCTMPIVMQLLLHEMTHVLYPDEQPYHSARFWTTLKDKWLMDFDLVAGVGLNGDERPSGLSAQMLGLLSYCNDKSI